MEGPVAFLSENTMLLWQININRRGVPKVFGSKTKKENQALRQATQGQQAQIQQMQQIIQECGAGDVLAARQALARAQHDQAQFVEQARIQRAAIDTDIAAAQRQLSDMQQEASKLSSSLIDLQSDVLMQDRGLFNFDNPAEDAIQLKAQLDDTKAQYKARVKAKTATHSVDGFTFNNSASKGKAFRSKMERMALRSYNAEAENAILTLKAGRLEAAEKRLQRACDQVNKLGEMISLHIDVDYHILRMRELRLTARYLEAKQQAKEAEREERARLREEARAERSSPPSVPSLRRRSRSTSKLFSLCTTRDEMMRSAISRTKLTKLIEDSTTSTTGAPTSAQDTSTSSLTWGASASGW